MKHIVKRKGHKEPFDSKKLYASIFAACMSLRMTDQEAELISENVTYKVEQLIKDKKEIASSEIHRHAAGFLNRYNPEAAFMYKHHRDIS